jgi:hypothetical protein
MEKPNRKIEWVHVTYLADGSIEITITVDRWRDSRFRGRRRKVYLINRSNLTRIHRLLRVLTRSTRVKHTIYSWNGYSVCYERVVL